MKKTNKVLGMRPESFEFLTAYLNNYSPSGYETAGQQLWMEYIKPYVHEMYTDVYGTAVGVVNPDAPYKVVLEAHADEIAWRVSHINDDGYIYVKTIGGPDVQIAPSKRVNIFTKDGIVKGVFGWPAVHVRKDDEPKPELNNIFIDVGATSKDEIAEMGIHIGCVVAFEDQLTTLKDTYLVGRALDNRIGGFMIAEVLRKLHKNGIKLPFGLYVVNAVQEEIGWRGAEMIARRIQPNVAIVTDVTHDTSSPLYDKIKDGTVACGKGPSLCYAPSVQNNLLSMLMGVAEQHDIPFQREVAMDYTGTDTEAFAYSNQGVASALISLPLKYMHTTVETAHKDDVKAVINLMYHFLLQLNSGHDFRYIK